MKPEASLEGWGCAWCHKPMTPPSAILKHNCTKVPAHVRAADKERRKAAKRPRR